MAMEQRKVAVRRTALSSNAKASLASIVVAIRRQAPEEERQLDAAVEVLLSEWVRLYLGRGEANHEQNERHS
ncbi:MAG TPA: hypothetical protein VFB66_22560 [Tepidisphaeraceae bacterium]|nr:hypothetical protein [Tepidisphaeraceae bacterium]